MIYKLIIKEGLSSVTKRVFKDFNQLSERDFFNKYSVTKEKYLRRVKKYGDPYMKSPLAKIGKILKGS